MVAAQQPWPENLAVALAASLPPFLLPQALLLLPFLLPPTPHLLMEQKTIWYRQVDGTMLRSELEECRQGRLLSATRESLTCHHHHQVRPQAGMVAGRCSSVACHCHRHHHASFLPSSLCL